MFALRIGLRRSAPMEANRVSQAKARARRSTCFGSKWLVARIGVAPSRPYARTMNADRARGPRDASRRRENDPADRREITVLLVADDRFRAALLEATLSESFDVHTVADDEAALAAVAGTAFDVCVIDTVLVGERVRGETTIGAGGLPIVLCGSPGVAAPVPAAAVVAQPLSGRRLVEAVESALSTSLDAMSA
jgi:hypothetical protein